MRRLWIPIVALVLLVPAGVSADGQSDTQKLALEALKTRLDAKMREAALLESSGRTEEALEAYREVGKIYDAEVQRIVRLFPSRRVWTRIQAPRIERRRKPLFPPTAPKAPEPNAADVSRALDRAIDWLVAHQSPNGGWEAAGFGMWCNGKSRDPETASKMPDGAGKALYDVGVTGLAAQALLAAGHTPGDETDEGSSLQRALRYLLNVQDSEGCFGPRSTQQYVYNHACAAVAVVEAYRRTKDEGYKAAAQRALDFTALSRNPYFGWRYGIKPGDNDTSVTTWMLAVIKHAKVVNREAVEAGRPAPLTVDESAYDGAKAWLQKVTDPDYGKVGYLTRGSGSARPQELMDRFPSERSEAMTSAGVLMRYWMGERMETHGVIRKSVDLILRTLPVWNEGSGQIDMYAWLLGTKALSKVGGKPWKQWRNAACHALLGAQQKGKACDAGGSWNPVGPWGPDGGRVYATALCAIMLATCKAGL